ncbi:MAG: NADH-quinone oxidoreductase subunit L [Candidatus Melainabacteria bacterium]|nr:NADH-quinone oxidoreductase subunit L [Candidatus Melainabacteria bacterium]
MNWLLSFIWLVPIYPLISFLGIVLGRAVFSYFPSLRSSASVTTEMNEVSEKAVSCYFPKSWSLFFTLSATLLGLFHALASLFWLLAQSPTEITVIEKNIPWLQVADITFSFGYLLDPMSVMMLFVVTFVSLLIQIYTHGYMHDDAGYAKFYSFLSLFNFSMLGLVLSSNLFQTYIFWELVGVSSYLLIGFWFFKPSAAAAALKAFLMNRIGDFGLLLGLLSFLFFTLSWWQSYLLDHSNQALLSFQAISQSSVALLESAGPELTALVAILVLMGPVAKSAQVPLHTWLPDAMEGPTPISALIHAATMVAAGIYLVGRVYPLFQASEVALIVVTCIGVLTALIGAFIAITQTDIKKALAYSTMSQLGFMMTAMGVGAFSAALFHLFTHAFFKAMLFLCSGSVIHACDGEQDMRKMGGLFTKLPVTAWTYLIGTVAISGLFWTSGFWSKDEILLGLETYASRYDFAPVVFYLMTFAAGLTAFYMFRTFFMTFMGQYRGDAHVHSETPVMSWPLAILAVPSLFVGVALSGLSEELPSFASYLTPVWMEQHHQHTVSLFSDIGNRSQIIGLTGLLLAALIYGPWNLLSAELFRKLLAPFHKLSLKKFYFDELYSFIAAKVYWSVATATALFDRKGIDGLVSFTGQSVMFTGSVARYLQTGQIQLYIAVLFFALFVSTLFFLYKLQ